MRNEVYNRHYNALPDYAPVKIKEFAPGCCEDIHSDCSLWGNCGFHYVYVWVNSFGRVFYVGKGTDLRVLAVGKKIRSESFMREYNNGGCFPKVLEFGPCDACASSREKIYIEVYDRENPLCNRVGTERYQTHLLDRQREGIELKKARGEYKGRTPIDVDKAQFKQEYDLWKSGQITARTAMNHLGVKSNTFYRRVKQFENTLDEVI